MATLLAVVAGCQHHHRARETTVFVYSQAQDSLVLAGKLLRVGYSNLVSVPNGATDSLALTRHGEGLGVLVITSLVPADDAHYYDAAVNIHEDSPGVLYAVELSPHIDAVIVPIAGEP